MIISFENNITIDYDSHTNTVRNIAGEILSLPQEYSDEWYEEQASNHGVETKVKNPIAIRILLGHACNYNCTYCMQKDIGNPNERPQSIFTKSFIENIKKSLDLSRLHRVELWGGEPFLYWKDMVELITFFDAPDREFFISTNGSAFVQKHVDFFKDVKARVLFSVSHDAVKQEELRGEDILKNPKKVDIIKQLMNLPNVSLGFSSVVNNHNHDLYAINDYFRDFRDREGLEKLKITFIPVKNYDYHGKDEYSAQYMFKGKELEDFSKHLYSFIQDSLVDRDKYLFNNLLYSDEGVISYAQFLSRQKPITTKSGCGADSNNILSVDIQGNIRLCPHTDSHFTAGKLENIESVKIHGLDIARKKTHCMKCPVKRLCRSSCPIKFSNEVFYSNCAFEKVWWGAIQRSAFELLFQSKIMA